jgi:hypothetical protein
VVAFGGCASEFCEGDRFGLLRALPADAKAPPRMVGGRAIGTFGTLARSRPGWQGLSPCRERARHGRWGAGYWRNQWRDGQGPGDWGPPSGQLALPPALLGLLPHVLGHLWPGFLPSVATRHRPQCHHRLDMGPCPVHPGPLQPPCHDQLI